MAGNPTGLAVLNQGLQAAAVTADDNTIVGPTRGLYVGDSASTHSLVVIMWGDTTATSISFANVPSGSLLPLNVAKVMAATTCTDVVALY